MLQEVHYPSRWSMALVFLVIFLLIVGVFVWAFYLDFGKLTVRSDRGFSLEIAGETYDCSSGVCELSLHPARYSFVAGSPGYYDEEFDLQVQRFFDAEKEISFTLIPYLREIAAGDIPGPEKDDVYFDINNGGLDLLMLDGGEEKIISSFDSLTDPRVEDAAELAIVLDEARLFVVDLETGRKTRRFDDTIRVNDARLSDNAERILLFVTMEDRDFVWLWENVDDELRTYDWYADPNFVQWETGKDHRLFVVSDQLKASESETAFAEAFEAVQPAPGELALWRYNLDNGEVIELVDLEGREVVDFSRIGERYFLEFEGAVVEELVVR